MIPFPVEVHKLYLSRSLTNTIYIYNSSKPVSDANVDGKVIYASGSIPHGFSGTTDANGEIDPYAFPIGGNSNTGIFHVDVDVSAKGYETASETKSFRVTGATTQNTTNIINMTNTNATTTMHGNNTSGGGNNDNNTGGIDNNNTSTGFSPILPFSMNSTENGLDQQGQTLADTGSGNTTSSGDNKDKVISNPTIGGNFSDIGTHSHPKLHHSSKHKETTGDGTPGGGSGGGGGDGGGGCGGGGSSGGSSGGSGGSSGSSRSKNLNPNKTNNYQATTNFLFIFTFS